MDWMEPEQLWDLFCMTGEPLAYMLYRSADEHRRGQIM